MSVCAQALRVSLQQTALHCRALQSRQGALPTCDLVPRRQQLQRGGISQQGMCQLVLWVPSPSDLVLQVRVLGGATVQGLPASEQGRLCRLC